MIKNCCHKFSPQIIWGKMWEIYQRFIVVSGGYHFVTWPFCHLVMSLWPLGGKKPINSLSYCCFYFGFLLLHIFKVNSVHAEAKPMISITENKHSNKCNNKKSMEKWSMYGSTEPLSYLRLDQVFCLVCIKGTLKLWNITNGIRLFFSFSCWGLCSAQGYLWYKPIIMVDYFNFSVLVIKFFLNFFLVIVMLFFSLSLSFLKVWWDIYLFSVFLLLINLQGPNTFRALIWHGVCDQRGRQTD